MIRTDGWQVQTIEEFQSTLMSNNDVLALAVFGSALHAKGQFDTWSDVDCLLVIADDAYSQYFPTIEWLRPLSSIYTYSQSETSYYGTTRVCFSDLRRLDVVITTLSRLEQLAEWPRNPFWQGVRLLFSRSLSITRLLSQTWPAVPPTFLSPAEFDDLVNQFWFKAMLASYKVVRNDCLVALHLALDLTRDCCVVGMILRDRATGTHTHRDGGMGNPLAARLGHVASADTPLGILDLIERSAIQFDQLAAEWSGTYRERRWPLLEWLEHIRRALNAG